MDGFQHWAVLLPHKGDINDQCGCDEFFGGWRELGILGSQFAANMLTYFQLYFQRPMSQQGLKRKNRQQLAIPWKMSAELLP